MGDIYAPTVGALLAFVLCFWAWALFELWVNLRGWSPGTRNRDRWTRYLILGGMVGTIALALAATRWHRWDLAALRPGLFYLGLTLMAAGLLFRGIAIRQLGRFFVPEVAIQPGQPLLTSGLYRTLRHPSYTGTFITVVGFGLALTNALSLLIMLLGSIPLYLARIHVEEQALVEAFGDEYRAYQRRSWRLIPWIF